MKVKKLGRGRKKVDVTYGGRRKVNMCEEQKMGEGGKKAANWV